jgi:drug/metabolite transporter (DMT)-like permease
MIQPSSKALLKLFALMLFLDVLVLLLEKMACNQATGDGLDYYMVLLKNPLVWICLVAGPFQLWIWKSILARTDLSLAYPVSSLSYPLTMLCAQWLLGEQLSGQIWMGGLLITLGVCFIGFGNNKSSPQALHTVIEPIIDERSLESDHNQKVLIP